MVKDTRDPPGPRPPCEHMSVDRRFPVGGEVSFTCIDCDLEFTSDQDVKTDTSIERGSTQYSVEVDMPLIALEAERFKQCHMAISLGLPADRIFAAALELYRKLPPVSGR